MAGETVVAEAGRGTRLPVCHSLVREHRSRAPGGVGAAGGGAGVVAFRAWLGAVDVAGCVTRTRVDLVAELERVKGSASAVQARATDA